MTDLGPADRGLQRPERPTLVARSLLILPDPTWDQNLHRVPLIVACGPDHPQLWAGVRP
jgi:hypothetical protein